MRPIDDSTRDERKAARALRLSLWAGLAIVGILAPLALYWLFGEPAPLQSSSAPDGSRLALLGWTFGSQHEFFPGPRWQSLAWPLVPPAQRVALPMSRYERNNPPPRSLVLWMQRTPPVAGFLGPSARRTAVDDHGCELTVGDNGDYAGEVGGALSRVLEPWAIDRFPRRGSTFRVRNYELDRAGRPALALELSVPNPDTGPHPSWQPEPLPTSRTQNGVTFALVSFRTGLRQFPAKGPVPPGEEAWSRATFRITRGGRSAPAWHARGLAFSDATGNSWEPSRYVTDLAGAERDIEIPVGLCDREPYRLRTRFTDGKTSTTLEFVAVPVRGDR